MALEPNFVLSIKQTSLANKKDSHVHTAIRSHTCLSAGSRLHSISQPPWLTAVSRSSSPSNPCLSLSNPCTTSLRLMKPTRQTCSMAYHDQNPGTQPPTTAACAITHGQRLLELSHAPPRQPCRPPIYLAWKFGGHTTLHAPTRAVWVSVLPPRAFYALKNSCWCHQVTSSLQVSSHASTSTSALVHVSDTS